MVLSSWVRWTYDFNAKPQDPINVIFRNLKLEDIVDFLLSHGWNQKIGLAFDQYLPHPDLHNLQRQDAQLQYGNILNRVHARFWKFQDDVLANVHHEIASIPQHIIQDYHMAEMFMAGICRGNQAWKVDKDAFDLANFFAGHGLPHNDGKATIVSK